MKISKTTKVLLVVAALAPLASYAAGTDLMGVVSEQITKNLLTTSTKTAAYGIGGFSSLITYLSSDDHRAFYKIGGITVALPIISYLATGSIL